MSHPLKRRIALLRSRVRRLLTLYGLSWIVGAVVAAVIVLGLADYLLRFQDRGIRVICSLAVLGALGWTAYRYLLVVLTTPLSDVELARRLQQRFPKLGDGLASAVEFIGQSEDDPTAGSVALRRAVISQTTAETDPLDFRDALRAVPALRAALATSGICLAALVLVVVDPGSSGRAIRRLINPFGTVSWPQTTHLAILDRGLPKDRVVAGEPFQIEVIDIRGAKLPSELRIRYRYEQDGGTSEETKPLERVDGVRVARRNDVTRPFSYRLETADHQSLPWIPVAVIPPGAEASLSAGSDLPPGPEVAVARLISTGREAPDSPRLDLAILSKERRKERVAAGGAFELEVVDAGGAALPPMVRIHYRFQEADGAATEETELMHYVDGVMVARRENVTRSFSYRVEGGDDQSMPPVPVEVVEPPAVESLRVRLIPPEYTGWPAETADKLIHALVGTRVEISARSTKPLKTAFLCFEEGPQVEGRVTGEDRRHLAAEFVVERSGAYWFRLTDVEGLAGGDDARWEIRAVPDAPPTVSIERPAGNVFVTPEAVVPLHVAVKDDQVVRQVEVLFNRSDRSEEEPSVLSLYAGPERVEPRAGGLSGGSELGHNLVLPPYEWQLSELGLQPGAQVTFHAKATDYRPNTGVSEPRRLVIITPEELTDRIASRQAAILSELSRVLEMQRKSRGQVGDLEIRLGEVGRLTRLDLDHLRGAELSQRQVDRTLTSPTDGLPMHVLALLADLENNRVDSPDVQRQMQKLLAGIDQLDRELLPAIERELTAAIKAAEVRLEDQRVDAPSPDANNSDNARPESDPAVVDSLAGAGRRQDQVIASLERMLDELGQWDRYRRFHSEISQLLRRQEDLRESTRELGSRTLTKTLDDLLPDEAADLKIAARRQFDLARQLDDVQQAMERASDQLLTSNPLLAETVSDALYRARELAISGQMRSCASEIQGNRMGQAIGRQEQIIQGLREILDILANRRENELERLVKQLRDAEARLAEAARQEEGLRKAMEQAEQRSDEAQRRRELERLSRQQEQLQEQAERIARRLQRLMAETAGQTVAQAAQKMQQAAQSARQGDSQGASKQAAGAKRDLDEAGRQVARQRLEAEIQLALEQLARLEQTLQGMHRRQEEMIRETQRLDQLAHDQGQLTRAQSASLHQLARAQGLLQTETVALVENLVGAEVFHLALSGAAREMGRAAALLDRRNTGAPTQQAEQNALRRLGQLLEALKPEEPEEDPDSAKGGQGGQGASGQPPGSGIQTLVELKLLKLLQEEVNRRTQELESTFGQADPLPAEVRREYVELSAEQGRLADLLLNLITPQEDPEGNPEDFLDAPSEDVLEPPLDEESPP